MTEENTMIVTAWKGGSYGLKLGASDRDRYFSRSYFTVFLELPGQSTPVEVNTDKKSFWGNCRELIHRDIGDWLKMHGYAPWKHGQPPKFRLEKVGERRFRLISPRFID